MLQRNISEKSKKEVQTSGGRDAILWQISPREEREMQTRSGPIQPQGIFVTADISRYSPRIAFT